MIDVANEISAVSVLLIVVGISATVIAEFFIHSSLNRFPAIKTVSFFLSHRQKVSINLED